MLLVVDNVYSADFTSSSQSLSSFFDSAYSRLIDANPGFAYLNFQSKDNTAVPYGNYAVKSLNLSNYSSATLGFWLTAQWSDLPEDGPDDAFRVYLRNDSSFNVFNDLRTGTRYSYQAENYRSWQYVTINIPAQYLTSTFTFELNAELSDLYVFSLTQQFPQDDWWVYNIDVMATNQPPTINNQTRTIAENSTGNVGTALSASDPEGTVTFSIVGGTGANLFNISNSGQLSVKNGAVLNYEAQTSYAVNVRVTDNRGQTDDAVITVNLTNVNEAPTGISLANSAFPENAGANYTIGAISGNDPDAGASLTYSLPSGIGSNSLFNISGASLRTNSSFDFESNSTYSITIRATDAGGLTFDKVFTISVTNVNEDPTDISLSDETIEENAAVDSVVGILSTADPDDANSFTYSLVSGDGDSGNSSFRIDGNILKSNNAFDFEVMDSYSIRIRSTDQDGLSVEKILSISVTDINEAPLELALSQAVVADNAPIGTLVGVLSTNDSDFENTFTYALVAGTGDSDNASFTINGDELRTNATFDFGTQNAYSIRVQSTDQGGLSLESTFTISVTNVFLETNGLLTVNGTNSDNVIAVSQFTPSGQTEKVQVVVDGISHQFEAAEVSALIVNGKYGNDTVTLSNTVRIAATLNGDNGNDTLTGGRGNDILNGGSGNDKLNGADGNDVLAGGSGDDVYAFHAASSAEVDTVSETNSAGTDTISFAGLTVPVKFTLGSSQVQAVHSNRTLKLNSAANFERLVGGSSNDVLAGNAQANTIDGGPGNDTLNGAAGNDVLAGGTGDDTYLFSAATMAEADSVFESNTGGIDTISFAGLTVPVKFTLGSSLVQAVHTNRTLKLNFAANFEKLIGGSTNDVLTGNALANTIEGGPGNDTLDGAAGNDVLAGGSGDDLYFFSAATTVEADTVSESNAAGTDTISFAGLKVPVTFKLGSTLMQAVHANRTLKLNSSANFENVLGGSANDVLTGNTGANVIVGGNGNDTLKGAGGRDILIGGLGLDTLDGGDDEDILIAGRTSHDNLAGNLNILRTAWISTDSYATRISQIRAGVGSPTVALKRKANVINDAGDDDLMTGGNGTDWYFRALDDVINDLVEGEILDLL